MKCGFFDIGCHISTAVQTAAWEWWSSIGFINKALIVLGLVALILGVLRGFLSLVHRLGGWPAVAGVVAAVLGLVLAVLPRKPQGKDAEFNGELEAGPDTRGPFRFGVERKKKKRPRGKRVFDLDLSRWVERP